MGVAPSKAWRELASSWDAWFFTLAYAVAVPTLGYFRFRQLLRLADHFWPTRRKLIFYGKIICSQWLLAATMLVIARYHGLSKGDLGEGLADPWRTAGATLVLVLILAVVFAILFIRLRHSGPKAFIRKMGRLQSMTPTFGPEMAGYAVVCLTAGICEELLYRGWLVNILWAALGSVWVAVAVAGIAFGAGHIYQGAKGVLRTAFIGFQFGALYIMVGSLIPGQVLHAGFDFLIGLTGAFAISLQGGARREPPTGSSTISSSAF